MLEYVKYMKNKTLNVLIPIVIYLVYKPHFIKAYCKIY